MTALGKAYGRILDGCGLIAAALVLAMTALIVTDVLLRNWALLRYLIVASIPASVELTEYALFYATCFAAPWLLHQGQHIRIDVVLSRVPPAAAWVVEIVCDLIGLSLSVLLTGFGVVMVARSMNAGTLMVKNMVFPEWYALWPLPVMFALLTVEFVFRIQRLVTGPRQARREGGSV